MDADETLTRRLLDAQTTYHESRTIRDFYRFQDALEDVRSQQRTFNVRLVQYDRDTDLYVSVEDVRAAKRPTMVQQVLAYLADQTIPQSQRDVLRAKLEAAYTQLA